MGDLKTPFNDPGYPNAPDLGGDSIASRGSDPNADGGDGPAGLTSFWQPGNYPWMAGQPVPAVSTDPTGEESANSVSGLPALPNRFTPSAGGVDLPSLDRPSPGTIDKQ